MEPIQRVQPQVFPVEKISVPEARSIVLKNGVPAFMIESGTEEILRLEFIFKAGQARDIMPLLSSTTNMMLSEGSANYTSEELNRLIDYYGAFLNLSAEKDSAGIVIFFLNKHIEMILELCSEILFSPSFHETELNSLMNKRLRWFMVNREKVQNLAMDQFFESLFGKNHPYGNQLNEKDFNNLRPSHLKDFHSKYYNYQNMAIIISGRIPDNIEELLNKYYGEQIAVKYETANPDYKMEPSLIKKVNIEKPGAVQTAIRIGSPTINKRHPDYTGLKFLNTLLGGYFSSRLMKNIREVKGYTYGINSSVSSLDQSGYKVISTDTGKKNCQSAIDEIYKEIHKLQVEYVSIDEIEVVRNYMSGELLRMFDGPFALAESFRAVWDFGLDNSYYFRLAEKIKTIDADEIISLARTYYNLDELYQITAG